MGRAGRDCVGQRSTISIGVLHPFNIKRISTRYVDYLAKQTRLKTRRHAPRGRSQPGPPPRTQANVAPRDGNNSLTTA